jgi:AraC-like DNA-binding protein
MQVIGIRLRPGVAFLLTGVCAERWVGRRESLGELLGSCVSELAVQISASTGTDAQFDLLESFLVARLEGKEVDRRVCIALHLTQRSRGAMRVSEIARRCGLSCRQLERLLRVWIGISPKHLARIARFQAALVSAGEQPASAWTYVAAEQNYVDQAHLIHEFSGFTGATPRALSRWPPRVILKPIAIELVGCHSNGSGEVPLQVELKTIHDTIVLVHFSLADLHRKCGRSHSHVAATMCNGQLILEGAHDILLSK